MGDSFECIFLVSCFVVEKRLLCLFVMIRKLTFHTVRAQKKRILPSIMRADVETQYSRSTAAALDTMLKACLVGDSGRSTFSVAAGIFGTAVDEASPPQALLPLVAAGALSLAGDSDDPGLKFDEQSAVNLAAKSGFTAAELTVSRVLHRRAFRALVLYYIPKLTVGTPHFPRHFYYGKLTSNSSRFLFT